MERFVTWRDPCMAWNRVLELCLENLVRSFRSLDSKREMWSFSLLLAICCWNYLPVVYVDDIVIVGSDLQVSLLLSLSYIVSFILKTCIVVSIILFNSESRIHHQVTEKKDPLISMNFKLIREINRRACRCPLVVLVTICQWLSIIFMELQSRYTQSL